MSVINDHIVALSAYKPPLEGRDPERYTLLDFNERTIPVMQPVIDALDHYIHSGRMQMYPSYGDIVPRLANYCSVRPEQVMITNGSDQGIDLVFRAVSEVGAEAIIPGPSFAMYQQCARIENMTLIEPLYQKENGYPLEEVLSAISPATRIIVVSNPNNPCGTEVSDELIVTIANAAPHAAVLVDECYFEYSRRSIAGKIDNLPNVFITRTFSKTWGMPSLRFGYLIASPDNIQALCNIRGPYDINQMAVVAAHAALDHPRAVQEYVAEVMGEAKPLLESWLKSQGIEYWASHANYIWCFPERANEQAQSLEELGFLVRPKAYEGRLGLRVTIGTVEQVQRLIIGWGAVNKAVND